MKQISTIIIVLVTMICIGGCGQQQEKVIEEIVATYPANTTVKIENDYVKVVEFIIKPGEKLPLHKGGRFILFQIISLSGLKVTKKQKRNGQKVMPIGTTPLITLLKTLVIPMPTISL
jgi:hypothetical protein